MKDEIMPRNHVQNTTNLKSYAHFISINLINISGFID
jgi:hypothetical protein